MGSIYNPAPSGSELTVAETQVYNASAPVTWTDLDLSSVVGANSALVVLKCAVPTGSSCNLAVRKNGDTDEFSAAFYSNSVGCAAGQPLSNSALLIVLLVATDINGIIEIEGSAAHAITIDVIGYIA